MLLISALLYNVRRTKPSSTGCHLGIRLDVNKKNKKKEGGGGVKFYKSIKGHQAYLLT